jgi:hypothetical protein
MKSLCLFVLVVCLAPTKGCQNQPQRPYVAPIYYQVARRQA